MRNLPHIASPALAPSDEPLREDKFTTQDGRIWPVARDRMASPNTIRQRMQEDGEALLRERGAEATITQDDFQRLGWTRGQVSAHSDHVMRHLAEFAGELARAAALILFCGGVLALAYGVGGA